MIDRYAPGEYLVWRTLNNLPSSLVSWLQVFNFEFFFQKKADWTADDFAIEAILSLKQQEQ